MPRWSSRAAWARTMSATVTTGKRRFHGWPVGIERERAGGAHAAAQHVDADDEVARRIEHLARADQALPPAFLAGDGMLLGDELVERQRMADQDGVRLVGVERAVGLVGHAIGAELDAAVEPKRPLDAQDRVAAPGQRLALGVGQRRRRSQPPCPLLGAANCQRKSPRPARAGAFFERSDLLARINVVASRSAQIPRRGLYTEVAGIAQAPLRFLAFTGAGRT